MVAIGLFLLRNWKVVTIGLTVLSLAGTALYYRASLIAKGKQECETEIRYETITEVIEIDKQLDEIRANEPDVERNLDRMWNGKF